MSNQSKSLVAASPYVIGAHNDLIPTNPPLESITIHKRFKKPIRLQRIYLDPDTNIAQDTPLFPPYQTYSDALDRLNGAVNNHFNNKPW